jgi:Protein of unknown function (DUF3309)/Transglycosylase associated protein
MARCCMRQRMQPNWSQRTLCATYLAAVRRQRMDRFARALRRPPRRNSRCVFIGSWLLAQLGLHLGLGIISAIINATIGAMLLLLVIRLVRGGGGMRRSWGGNWERRVEYLLLRQRERKTMSIGTILLIISVIVLLGGFSGFGGGPFYGTGYYGGGGLGLVLVIVLALVLLGRL